MEPVLKRIRLYKKLWLIYALNVVDWICTVVLVHSGRFYEANPLMRSSIGDVSAGFFVKCVLSAVVVMLLGALVRMLSGNELRIADCFIAFCLVFYLTIDLDHVINFILLFFQNSP